MPSANTTSEFARNGDGQNAAATKDIEAQIQQLRDDISALARSIAAVGNEKAGEVRGKARRAANEAADASLHMVEAAREQALSLERDLERQIRTNPIQAVAIAAGVGFLFALMTRR
ncbi:YqjD family protein [Rhizobium puerariae]|uniref:YqjD family protein n=1 Tax=Rhizobium puerariae TaxID=1585791 RepID=A0ABV6AHN2_9HYPH